MLQYFVIGISICLSVAADPAGEDLVPDDKGQCVNNLIQWCNGIEYPQEGGGRSVLWLTYEDPSGHNRVLCVSDCDGTNCTRNGLPWLSCSSDNKFFYNGNQLKENFTDGVDADICKIADKVCNEYLGQNLSYNNTKLELQKELKCFFDQIASMKEQIEALHERMRIYLTFGNGFNNSSVTESISSNSPTVTPGTSAEDN